MKSSGEILRQLRQLKGIKQDSVARALGISQPAYCKIEKCEKIDQLKFNSIATIMGYSDSEIQDLVSFFLEISPKHRF